MSIQPNSRVVCIRILPWRNASGVVVFDGPINGTIYLVSCVTKRRNLTMLGLAGLGGLWDADEFRLLTPACDRMAEEKRAESA